MYHSKLLKIVSLLSILAVLSANPSMAETTSDSLVAPSKFRLGFVIGPIATYAVMSKNQVNLNRVYDISEMPFSPGKSVTFDNFNAKLTGGFTIGFSLTYRIAERLNVNISPTFNLIAPKINSTLNVKSEDSINFPNLLLSNNALLAESNFEFPISLETNPFKSKPNFLTSAGLSVKYETFNSIKIKELYGNDGPRIITNRFYFDFFLSSKFLKPKKQNGIELRFSYSLRDIIHRKHPQPFFVNLPVNSIHLFTSSLLFHIR